MSRVPWHSPECVCPRCEKAEPLRLDRDSGEVIDVPIARPHRLLLRLEPSARESVANQSTKAFLSRSEPRWDTGDRVTVMRATRPGRDEFDQPTTFTDAPLHLRIADVQGPFAVGKLINGEVARQLGFKTMPEFVREWIGETERRGGTSLQKRMVEDGQVARFASDDTLVWLTMFRTEEVERPRFLVRTPQDSTDDAGHGYTDAASDARALLDAGEAPEEAWTQERATDAYQVWAPVREGRVEEAAERRVEHAREKRADRAEAMKRLTVRVPHRAARAA